MGLRIEVMKEEVTFNDMPRTDQIPLKQSGSINIKVIGSGSGGCNAINQMISENISGVDFIAVNTDVQALNACKASYKIAIGQNLTKGLGAGGNPDIGSRATLENKAQFEEILSESNMVFLTTGMGGGTGTGSLPVIAEIAKKTGAIVVAIVTMPFSFDGARKIDIARAGLEELRKHIDALIVIPNEKLLKLADKRASMLELFAKANDLLRIGVQGIVDLVNYHGHMNVDFNDVKSVLRFGGDTIMGEGYASGDNRALDALKNALNSPLVEKSDIDGAQGLLVNVTTGRDFGMHEYAEIMDELDRRIDNQAIRKNGWVVNPALNDEVHVTLIATGFNRPENIKQINRNFKPITASSHNYDNNSSNYVQNPSKQNFDSFEKVNTTNKDPKQANIEKNSISSDEFERMINNPPSSYDNSSSNDMLNEDLPSYLRLQNRR